MILEEYGDSHPAEHKPILTKKLEICNNLEIKLEIYKNLEFKLEIYKNLENKLEIYGYFKLEIKLEIFEFFVSGRWTQYWCNIDIPQVKRILPPREAHNYPAHWPSVAS